MSWATCCDCGQHFERENHETWKTRCKSCYFKEKNKINPSQSRAEVQLLEQEVSNLKAMLWKVMHEPSGIDRELAENWRALVQLAHPDKHGGSAAANRVTQWLNDIKGRLQCH